MSLYFFHLRDGVDIVLDEEGRELNGFAAVPGAALVEARSIIAEDVRSGRVSLDQRIDVEDESNAIVYSLEFADAVQFVNAVPKPR